MRFGAILALALGLFIALPILAHRLRRRRSKEVEFAGTRLVDPSATEERKRSEIEDRGLLALRVLSILALACLGASPFVRCSRVGVDRNHGASVAVAIVLDDSMSMRTKDGRGSRFERAKAGALELAASLQDGDSISVVLASRPARVLVASTNDLRSAKEAIRALEETDRATDLDGALQIARGITRGLPQSDRQVALFSDLADGSGSTAPLGDDADPRLLLPLPTLAAEVPECGVVQARRSGKEVRATVHCSDAAAATQRKLELRGGERTLAEAPLLDSPREDKGPFVIERLLTSSDEGDLEVRLVPGDALTADDSAAVLVGAKKVTIAILSAHREAGEKNVDPIERAGAALHSAIGFVPLGALPDRADEVAAFGGIVVDDPAGFTPEERQLLIDYVKKGGFVFLGLGPRSTRPAIGSSFAPFLEEPVRWATSPLKGAKGEGAWLPEVGRSFSDFAPGNVARFGGDDLGTLQSMLLWDDGSPFLARRAFGSGEVWFLSLPFDVEISDVALRPGFLSMLDDWFERVRGHHDESAVEVGGAWTFDEGVTSESAPFQVSLHPVRGGTRVEAERIGRIRLRRASKAIEQRVAYAAQKEMSLRPRPVANAASSPSGEAGRREFDISWIFALMVLVFGVLELGIRVFRRRVAANPS